MPDEHKAMPTPEEIMWQALYKNDPTFPRTVSHSTHWKFAVKAQIKALTDAGKVIVDRGLLQQSERALTVALEIAGKAFEEARGVERSGSPGEGQWEDMQQIDHALNQVRAMTKDTGHVAARTQTAAAFDTSAMNARFTMKTLAQGHQIMNYRIAHYEGPSSREMYDLGYQSIGKGGRMKDFIKTSETSGDVMIIPPEGNGAGYGAALAYTAGFVDGLLDRLPTDTGS